MAVDVLTETVIDCPLERVAAYACDPSKAPEWYVNIETVEWKTPPPLAVGSRMAFVARFFGEVITAVFVPEAVHASHSSYLKVRDRFKTAS